LIFLFVYFIRTLFLHKSNIENRDKCFEERKKNEKVFKRTKQSEKQREVEEEKKRYVRVCMHACVCVYLYYFLVKSNSCC